MNDEQCVSTRFAAAALQKGHQIGDLGHLALDPGDVRVEAFPNMEDYLDTLHFDDVLHLDLTQRSIKVCKSPEVIVSRNDGELQETLQALHDHQEAAAENRERIILEALGVERPVIRDLHGHWTRVATPWADQLWAPIQVWYISHAAWRICPFPRTAWLNEDFTLWYRTIVDTWNDQIDPLDSVTLLIVTPQPEREEGTPAIHVMLVQHDVLPEEGAALVTLQDDGYRDGRLEHQALVLPLRITNEVLLTVANRLTLCLQTPRQARCSTRFGIFDLTHEPMRGRPGLAYHIDIRRAAGGLGSALFPTTLHDGVPRFVRDLHTAIFAHQRADPGEIVNLRIVTWFLNHHSANTCLYYREVDLPPEPGLWLVTILNHWPDLYLMQYPIEAFLVSPTPQNTQWSPGDQYHIILHQQPVPGYISVIATTFDGTRGLADPPGSHRAVVIPRHFHRRDVLQKVELLDWCNEDAIDRRCQVHYTALHIDDVTGCVGDHGFSLRITLPHLDAQLWGVPQSSDETSFLQRPQLLRLHDHIDRQSTPTKVDCKPAFEALAQLDGIFLLPNFEIDELLAWHWSSAWLQPWWDGITPFDEVAIYFDGSYRKGPPACAGIGVASFVRIHSNWFFAGFYAGSIGEEADSYQAEQTAAAVAIKVIYDLLRLRNATLNHPIQVNVFFDSITVGQQARGGWATRQHPTTGKAIRSLIRLCEAAFGTFFRFEHIKSHTGHPGNELADYLADGAAQGWSPFTMDLSPWLNALNDAGFVRSLEWCWILFDRQFAPLWQGTVLSFPSLQEGTWDDDLLNLRKPPISSVPTLRRRLRLCSYNALTVAGEAHDEISCCAGPAKLQIAIRQFQELGFHIFALQETRLRHPGLTRIGEYQLFHAAADSRGHFGITIGISTKRPYAPDPALVFQAQHVHIVNHSPRVLILYVNAPGLKFLVLGLHAPHTGNSLDEISAWWAAVEDAIPHRLRHLPVIVLADANAEVGSFPSEHIGAHQHGRFEEKSEPFVEFISNQQCFLPATFENWQFGTGDSWVHARGSRRRIDYVGLPLAWSSLRGVAWVQDDFETTIARDDHYPVCADTTFEVEPPSDHENQLLRPSPLKLEDYQLPADWWPELPDICWDTDVHSHAQNLQTQLVETIQTFPRRSKSKPLKTTLSETTWQLILDKKSARRTLHDLNALQKREILQACFNSWRQRDTPQEPADHANLDLAIAQTLSAFRTLGRQVTAAVRQDDRTFFGQLLNDGAELLAPHEVKQFWAVVRRSLPKFQSRRRNHKPLQMEALSQQWDQHFCDLEVGSITQEQSHWQMCCDRQLVGDRPSELSLFDLPSVNTWEDAVREIQPGKSTGLDPLPSNLYRQHAPFLSAHSFGLILKMYVHGVEPLQFKGGPMALIHKSRPMDNIVNYRGILLLPSLAKRVYMLFCEDSLWCMLNLVDLLVNLAGSLINKLDLDPMLLEQLARYSMPWASPPSPCS